MLGRFQVNIPEGLRCGNSQRIQRMCINPTCLHASLLCMDPDCSKCQGKNGELHLECSKIELRAITSHINSRVDQQKSFIAGTHKIEEQFITAIQRNRLSASQKYGYGSLEGKYAEIIKKIFEDQNSSFLKGREAEQFWKMLKNLKSTNDSLLNSFLETYERAFEKFIEEAAQIKERALEALFCQKEAPQKKEHSKDKGSEVIDSLILEKQVFPNN